MAMLMMRPATTGSKDGQDGPNLFGPHRFESFHGSGRVLVRHHAETAVLSHLHFTFPLKLMSPRTASLDAIKRIKRRHVQQRRDADRIADGTHTHNDNIKPVAAIYIVGYGGGLVSGDSVLVDVDVGSSCTTLLLTQGSTKVYKMRERRTGWQRKETADLPGMIGNTTTTKQEMRCIVKPDATLIVLPDPVTCFAQAKYAQVQRFDLRCSRTSSLVLLDWFTPGRVHLDVASRAEAAAESLSREKWAFEAYESRNEVRIVQHVVARDVLLLEQPHETHSEHDTRLCGPTIAQRCEPYTCYASLFLFGPDAQHTIARFRNEFHQIQQRNKASLRSATFDEVLWSCSPIPMRAAAANTTHEQCPPSALVVRIAGLSTEDVRHWLRERLADLQDVIGDDLYRQALGS